MTLPNSKIIHFQSANATTAFAQVLAPLLGAGDTILLSGELGSGKTHFARALIQARLVASDLTEDVPSPTYTLVQSYWDGVCDIWHADLYRLNSPQDVVELGLVDAMDNSICLIEWPDRIGQLTPQGALHIDLHHVDDADARRADISWQVQRWQPRMQLIGDRCV